MQELMQWLKDNWQAILVSSLGTLFLQIITVILILGYKGGLKPTLESLFYFFRRCQGISRSGIVTVICKRDDYRRYRKGTISEYIRQAKYDLIITSISLTTGVNFENFMDAITDLLRKRVQITISLLNPKFEEGIIALAKGFGKDKDSLKADIINSLRRLYERKMSLGIEEKNLFNLKVHSVVPFASAIMIDTIDPRYQGIIQLETKSYQAPLGESWAIELKGRDKILYKRFRESWLKLIQDANNLNPEEHLQ